jgi:hypothetical protein
MKQCLWASLQGADIQAQMDMTGISSLEDVIRFCSEACHVVIKLGNARYSLASKNRLASSYDKP